MIKRMKKYSVNCNVPFCKSALIVEANTAKEAYEKACKMIAPWQPNKSGIRVVK